jgi:hypothetical protein
MVTSSCDRNYSPHDNQKAERERGERERERERERKGLGQRFTFKDLLPVTYFLQ